MVRCPESNQPENLPTSSSILAQSGWDRIEFYTLEYPHASLTVMIILALGILSSREAYIHCSRGIFFGLTRLDIVKLIPTPIRRHPLACLQPHRCKHRYITISSASHSRRKKMPAPLQQMQAQIIYLSHSAVFQE